MEIKFKKTWRMLLSNLTQRCPICDTKTSSKKSQCTKCNFDLADPPSPDDTFLIKLNLNSPKAVGNPDFKLNPKYYSVELDSSETSKQMNQLISQQNSFPDVPIDSTHEIFEAINFKLKNEEDN